MPVAVVLLRANGVCRPWRAVCMVTGSIRPTRTPTALVGEEPSAASAQWCKAASGTGLTCNSHMLVVVQVQDLTAAAAVLYELHPRLGILLAAQIGA